jgi:hypothetical protein
MSPLQVSGKNLEWLDALIKAFLVYSKFGTVPRPNIQKREKKMKGYYLISMKMPPGNYISDVKRYNETNYIESLYFRTSLVFKSKILQISEMVHLLRPSCSSTR